MLEYEGAEPAKHAKPCEHEPWRHSTDGAFVDGDESVCVLCDAPIRLMHRWFSPNRDLLILDPPVIKPEREPLKLALNVAQKVGLPDYSSIDASMHVSGITVDTPEEEVAALVERGRIVFGHMAAELHERIKKARAARGWE